MNIDLQERYLGSMLGLAVGDALGVSIEFKAPGTFEPVRDMIGGGPFQLEPGQWTDDTSMALCLAESLLVCRGFNPYDQLVRYTKWYREGYYSSIGRCFDIGHTVKAALERFEQTREPFCGSLSPTEAGNGSLMRLAPVPLYYAKHPSEAVTRSGDSSLTTHAAAIAVDACRYMGGLIVGALQGVSKDLLLSSRFTPSPGYWDRSPLVPEIDEIACGSFQRRNPPIIQGSGYAARSLEAALWAFYNSDSFEEGCLLAVNLGDDSDTTGAVYGQLAGAYYGVRAIPERWLERLAMRDVIEDLAMRLYEKRVS